MIVLKSLTANRLRVKSASFLNATFSDFSALFTLGAKVRINNKCQSVVVEFEPDKKEQVLQFFFMASDIPEEQAIVSNAPKQTIGFNSSSILKKSYNISRFKRMKFIFFIFLAIIFIFMGLKVTKNPFKTLKDAAKYAELAKKTFDVKSDFLIHLFEVIVEKYKKSKAIEFCDDECRQKALLFS